MITLTALDLALASALVCLSAALTHALRLATAGRLLIASARALVQLLLVGLLLKLLFARADLLWVAAFAGVMLAIAGYETLARQRRPLTGLWGYGIGTLAMFLSSFSIAIVALTAIVGPNPWYTPQYAIPLLGMLLGNTMTGIAIALDRITQTAFDQRGAIEARLILGQPWRDAISDIRADSMRAGMIPTINAMAAAGVVSLPGMMKVPDRDSVPDCRQHHSRHLGRHLGRIQTSFRQPRASAPGSPPRPLGGALRSRLTGASGAGLWLKTERWSADIPYARGPRPAPR
jgi:putative ABC transport system permease protein